jgi:hypothetical protein
MRASGCRSRPPFASRTCRRRLQATRRLPPAMYAGRPARQQRQASGWSPGMPDWLRRLPLPRPVLRRRRYPWCCPRRRRRNRRLARHWRRHWRCRQRLRVSIGRQRRRPIKPAWLRGPPCCRSRPALSRHPPGRRMLTRSLEEASRPGPSLDPLGFPRSPRRRGPTRNWPGRPKRRRRRRRRPRRLRLSTRRRCSRTRPRPQAARRRPDPRRRACHSPRKATCHPPKLCKTPVKR